MIRGWIKVGIGRLVEPSVPCECKKTAVPNDGSLVHGDGETQDRTLFTLHLFPLNTSRRFPFPSLPLSSTQPQHSTPCPRIGLVSSHAMQKSVTVTFTPLRNCLINLPAAWANALLDQGKVARTTNLGDRVLLTYTAR